MPGFRDRLPGCELKRFGMSPAVVLGQDLSEGTKPVGDGALADLAAGDRQLRDGHRKAAGKWICPFLPMMPGPAECSCTALRPRPPRGRRGHCRVQACTYIHAARCTHRRADSEVSGLLLDAHVAAGPRGSRACRQTQEPGGRPGSSGMRTGHFHRKGLGSSKDLIFVGFHSYVVEDFRRYLNLCAGADSKGNSVGCPRAHVASIRQN